MAKELSRKNVRIEKDLSDWYEDKAATMGLSVNALMVVALNAYRDQQLVIPQIPLMMAMLQQGEAAKRNP